MDPQSAQGLHISNQVRNISFWRELDPGRTGKPVRAPNIEKYELPYSQRICSSLYHYKRRSITLSPCKTSGEGRLFVEPFSSTHRYSNSTLQRPNPSSRVSTAPLQLSQAL